MKYLIIITALFCSMQAEAKEKYYKWTDENGNTHYTEKKPKNIETDEVKVYNSKSTKINVAQDETKTEIPNEELTAEQKAAIEYNRSEQQRVKEIQDRENCIIAKKNKVTLEKSFSVKKKNPATGEYIKMDKSEITNKLKEVNKAIRTLCK